MNGLLIKIVIGFTYKILWWKKNIFVQCSVCNVNLMTGFLTANCSSRSLSAVPQDLDPKIEFLILNNNTFVRLNENSFGRYENLIMLSLENTAYLDQSDPINYYTFRPLKRLEMIVLNEIYTPFNFTFYWPPNIRLISLNHNNFASDMDFSALKKLRDVHAISRTIRTFPKFHGQSPLTFLDFRGNPMDSLTAEDLAPFCTIDVLSLEWPGHAVINGTERYCQCLRLENWIVMTRISTNADLNCTPPKDGDAERCSLEYPENIWQLRKDCINRINKPSLSGWFWLGLGFVLFAPLIIVSFRETKTHRRFSERPTKATRNPKYPDVKLRINVDEDFDDEYDSEIVESEQENDDIGEGKTIVDIEKSPETPKKVSPTSRGHLKENMTTPTQKSQQKISPNKKSPDSRSADVSPESSPTVENTKETYSKEFDSPSPSDTPEEIHSKKQDSSSPVDTSKDTYSIKSDSSSPVGTSKEMYSKKPDSSSPVGISKETYSIKPDSSSPTGISKETNSVKPDSSSPTGISKEMYSRKPDSSSPVGTSKKTYSREPGAPSKTDSSTETYPEELDSSFPAHASKETYEYFKKPDSSPAADTSRETYVREPCHTFSPAVTLKETHSRKVMEELSSLKESRFPRKEYAEKTKHRSLIPENYSPKKYDSVRSSPSYGSRKVDLAEKHLPTLRGHQSSIKEDTTDTIYRSPIKSPRSSPRGYSSEEFLPFSRSMSKKFDSVEEIKPSRSNIYKTPKKEPSRETIYENPISPETYSMSEYKSLEDMSAHGRRNDDHLSTSSHSLEEKRHVKETNESFDEKDGFHSS